MPPMDPMRPFPPPAPPVQTAVFQPSAISMTSSVSAHQVIAVQALQAAHLQTIPAANMILGGQTFPSPSLPGPGSGISSGPPTPFAILPPVASAGIPQHLFGGQGQGQGHGQVLVRNVPSVMPISNSTSSSSSSSSSSTVHLSAAMVPHHTGNANQDSVGGSRLGGALPPSSVITAALPKKVFLY